MKIWPLLISTIELLSQLLQMGGPALFCVSPRPVRAPVMYTVPSGPASRESGFGLAASGKVIDGVDIAVGPAGAAGAAGVTVAGWSSAHIVMELAPSTEQTTPEMIVFSMRSPLSILPAPR